VTELYSNIWIFSHLAFLIGYFIHIKPIECYYFWNWDSQTFKFSENSLLWTLWEILYYKWCLNLFIKSLLTCQWSHIYIQYVIVCLYIQTLDDMRKRLNEAQSRSGQSEEVLTRATHKVLSSQQGLAEKQITLDHLQQALKEVNLNSFRMDSVNSGGKYLNMVYYVMVIIRW